MLLTLEVVLKYVWVRIFCPCLCIEGCNLCWQGTTRSLHWSAEKWTVQTDKHYLLSKANEWWNAVYGVVCFVATLACFSIYMKRIIHYRHRLW